MQSPPEEIRAERGHDALALPDERAARPRLRALILVAAIALAAGLGVLFLAWPNDPPPVVAEATPAAAGAVAPAASAAASVPVILHPVEPVDAAASAPALAEGGIGDALIELLGRKAVLKLLQTDDFARRFVATVDNLGRSHAPTAMWPVNPTPDRFKTAQRDGGPVIDADNGQRYTPFVLMVEGVDLGRAMQLYRRAYPLLQRAYEELGYPKRYFNDRFVEVIDLLLATPEASAATKLQLTEVKGPIPSARPWVRYEFAEPRLETLSAGQKVLLRVGPVNQRRLKARLQALRQALAQAAPERR